jgi:hypothetical protein
MINNQTQSTFQPQREKLNKRFVKNTINTAIKPVTIGVASTAGGVLAGGIAGGAVGNSILGSSGMNILSVATGIVGAGVGASVGAVGGVGYGIVDSAVSIGKGVANIFGRKTPENTLVKKAISNNLSLGAKFKYDAILTEIGKGKSLQEMRNIDINTRNTFRTKINNKLDDISKQLGAKDTNIQNANTYLINKLGLHQETMHSTSTKDFQSKKTVQRSNISPKNEA